MEYSGTLSSAQSYARKNMLEEWVHAYLLSDGHNREFSEGLKLFDRYFLGPVKMPLSLFRRCCGPEENMKWRINEEWFERHVRELEDVIKKEKDMPPLIVHYLVKEGETNGEFELNDGNHRFEAYSRCGIEEYYVIVWITEKREYDLFMKKYSSYFTQN